MRTKVTESGVLIPKEWLEGIDEVEIQQAQNMIIVVPVPRGSPSTPKSADYGHRTW